MKKSTSNFQKHKIAAIFVALFGLVLDQVLKLVADKYVPRSPDCAVIIPGLIDFRYVRNSGAAFGLFASQRWIFLLSTTFFLGIAIYAFFRLKIKHNLINYSLMLIISGGVGNMIDRIFRGYVIDFINFSFVDFFVFNIADCCVVIGCGLFILYLILDFINSKKTEGKDERTSAE